MQWNLNMMSWAAWLTQQKPQLPTIKTLLPLIISWYQRSWKNHEIRCSSRHRIEIWSRRQLPFANFIVWHEMTIEKMLTNQNVLFKFTYTLTIEIWPISSNQWTVKHLNIFFWLIWDSIKVTKIRWPQTGDFCMTASN